MRLSRKGILYSCGNGKSFPISDLIAGAKVITRAGEKFTIIAQSHYGTGYPQNSTTLWSEVSDGTAYTVTTSTSSIAKVIEAAKNMKFSDGLSNIELDTTVYYASAPKTESSYVAKQFLLGYREVRSVSNPAYPSQSNITYVHRDGIQRARYHNGVAVNWALRDLKYGTSELKSMIYIDSTGYFQDASSCSNLYVFPVLNIPNTTKITGIDSEGYYKLGV